MFLHVSAERLHDFSIEVSREDKTTDPEVGELCFMYNGTATMARVEVACTTPLIGRYVRVRGRNTLNHKDLLQFCEVEIYVL